MRKRVAKNVRERKNKKQSPKGKVPLRKVKVAAPKAKTRFHSELRPSQRHFASTANPVARVRSIFLWSLLIATFFAVLSLVSSLELSRKGENNTTASFQSKMRQAATLTLLSSQDEPISLVVTGDVMLGRYVELKMRQLNDYTYPFKNVSDLLKSADVTFANLEAPLIAGRNTPKDAMTFRADPKGTDGLIFAGYDAMSIANNHTMNYGIAGMNETIANLRAAGISPVGAGTNQDEAHTPAIVEARGKKIAFYAYSDFSIPPGFHPEATKVKPGIARMDIEVMKNDVKNALEYADIVVVSMHAGKEYTREPTQTQKDFAHGAIDAGASLVVGHHPHWIQPVERYGSGLILYGLGNFVFDQFFNEEVRTGVIAKVMFEEDEAPVLELFPIRVNDAQPDFIEGEKRDEVLKKAGL